MSLSYLANLMVGKRVLQGYVWNDRKRPGLDPCLWRVGDKSKIPENAIIFSISLLGEEIYRMYWMIPCDLTTSRTKIYKRRQLKGGKTLGFYLQCELESR
ncbi:hypothetical protein AVEN_221772-1 [Araneus ventricosus]|uniref:Uncharacterized protein n=1 Tax=Araneus ventricosus TaxID=182803 RepID=A0A4Y2HA86_ARAVE|nr:hypothetical protein AVEN_221772-1 [Araneus ventricosus]